MSENETLVASGFTDGDWAGRSGRSDFVAVALRPWVGEDNFDANDGDEDVEIWRWQVT